jgi:hypothetical protein
MVTTIVRIYQYNYIKYPTGIVITREYCIVTDHNADVVAVISGEKGVTAPRSSPDFEEMLSSRGKEAK